MPVFTDNLREASAETENRSNENLGEHLHLPNKIQLQFSENEQHSRVPQRRPIPVSTIDLQSRSETQFIAISGLDFLNSIDSLCVLQTIELHDCKY